MNRRLFAFCIKNGDKNAKDFVRRFIHEDVLLGSKKSAESLWKDKNESVSKRFTTDEIAIQECNPYMLKFATSMMLENRVDLLTKSKSYLPAIFSCIIASIVKFWDTSEARIIKVLLHSAMQIIFFTREYLEDYCKLGVVEKLVNTPILTRIMKEIDFMSDSTFSEN